MIKVVNVIPKGLSSTLPICQFEFVLDGDSTIAIKTYQLGLETYFIGEGSIAKNHQKKIAYEYRNERWNKIPYTPPTETSGDSHVYTENGNKYKCAHAWHESQIRKCGIRTEGTMDRTAPDAIIIYRGTNDFSHEPYTVLTKDYFDSVDFEYPHLDDASTWTNVSCTWEKGGLTTQGGVKDDQNNRIRTTSIAVNGVYKLTIPSGFKCRLAYYSEQQTATANFLEFSDWFTEDTIVKVDGSKYARLLLGYVDDRVISADDVVTVGANIVFSSTSELIYGYKQGLVLTIGKLREAYPNAKILLCTLNVFKRVNYSHFPTNNGINTLPQYNNAIREVADYMGCGIIEFDKDGITFENCYDSGYIVDSATTPTHPSDKGHNVMGLKAIADLRAQYSKNG